MPVKEASPTELLEFPFESKELRVAGKTFSFRELSVQENDDCADEARDPAGQINGRTMMRLMIVRSSVEPKLTPKLVGALPQRVYAKIYDVVNELNNPDTLDEDEGAGNA